MTCRCFPSLLADNASATAGQGKGWASRQWTELCEGPCRRRLGSRGRLSAENKHNGAGQ